MENFDILLGLILGQCRPFHVYNIANNQQFKDRIAPLTPTDTTRQYSLDIESMYPSLPISDEAIEVIVA